MRGDHMIRFALVFASIFVAFSTALAQDDELSSEEKNALKGVSVVVYNGWLPSKDAREGRCAIDWRAFNVEMDFVANQSSKLRLMTDRAVSDEMKRVTDLTEGMSVDEILQTKAERDRLVKPFLGAPRLNIFVSVIELQSGCAGFIRAEVTAELKERAELKANGAQVFHPSPLVWHRNMTIRESYRDFPAFAMEISTQLMKSFVNDWARSQQAL
jgi:hypothetical protein